MISARLLKQLVISFKKAFVTRHTVGRHRGKVNGDLLRSVSILIVTVEVSY